MENFLDANLAAYDNLAKRVLSRKIILAHILKETVTEFADCSVEDKEKEFHGDDYSGLTEKIIHGNFHDRQSNYDLIKIIILNLGKNGTSHKLLNLLHLLFMDKKKTEEKEKILHDEYKIELTRNMKGELVKMGGLMEPLLEIAAKKATAETKKATLPENIRNLMDSTKWTL